MIRFVRISVISDDDDYQEPWKESDYYHEDADWWKGEQTVYGPEDEEFWRQRPYLQSVEHLNIDNDVDLSQWSHFMLEAWYFVFEYAQWEAPQGVISKLSQDHPDFGSFSILEDLLCFATHPATIAYLNQQLLDFEETFYNWDLDVPTAGEAYYLARNGYEQSTLIWNQLWREHWDYTKVQGKPVFQFMENFCRQQGSLQLAKDKYGLFALKR